MTMGRAVDVEDFSFDPATLTVATGDTVTWANIGATAHTVTFDGGLLSSRVATSSMFLHEFFHDGRHLFGVPCH